MINWLVWAFSLMGIVYFITESALAVTPRVVLSSMSDKLSILLYCRMCVGFWVGLVLGWAGLFPPTTVPFVSGLVAMGVMWFASGFLPRHGSFEEEMEAIERVRSEAKLKREQARKEKQP